MNQLDPITIKIALAAVGVIASIGAAFAGMAAHLANRVLDKVDDHGERIATLEGQHKGHGTEHAHVLGEISPAIALMFLLAAAPARAGLLQEISADVRANSRLELLDTVKAGFFQDTRHGESFYGTLSPIAVYRNTIGLDDL